LAFSASEFGSTSALMIPTFLIRENPVASFQGTEIKSIEEE
jgi:hypothetical protein